MTNPYISLTEAKAQLSIDDGLTLHDTRIQMLIGAATDWAENYTQRSLGELLELDSPADSNAEPLPDPKDSPHFVPLAGQGPGSVITIEGGAPLYMEDQDQWTETQWKRYWANNPMLKDDSKPLRRDVKAAILLYLETLFDRNTDNFELLQTAAENMLSPYRIGMGV